MKLLTLTPEIHLYASAILAVYALSSSELASYLQRRFTLLKRRPFLIIYVALMALIIGCSILVLDLSTILNRLTWDVLLLSLPSGIAVGWIAWWAELAVKRLLRQYSLRQQRRPQHERTLRSESAGRAPGSYWSHGTRGLARSEWSSSQVALVQPNPFRADTRIMTSRQVLIWLVFAGMLEEVLFRGVLIYLVFNLPSMALVIAGLTGSVLVFALSHLRLGYAEILAKFPLGLLALLVVLLMGSVVPAMVAHAFFNFRAWQAADDSGSVARVWW